MPTRKSAFFSLTLGPLCQSVFFSPFILISCLYFSIRIMYELQILSDYCHWPHLNSESRICTNIHLCVCVCSSVSVCVCVCMEKFKQIQE